MPQPDLPVREHDDHPPLDVPRMRFWGDRRPPKNRAEMFSLSLAPRAAAGDDEAPAGDDEGATGAQGGSVATLRIYGPIDSWGGFWGISARDVATALDELGDEVTELRVRINSPGGEAWEGLAILNLLRAHRVSVMAVVDGIAASAASVIATGVETTVMSPGSQLMIHDASTFAYGPASLMRKAERMLNSVSDSIASVYREAAGGTDAAWRALMIEETWYTAREAVSAGLAQRVAVVADAGVTDTAGEDLPDALEDGGDGDVEDRFDLSIYNYAGRSHAPAPKQPAASATGSPSQPAPAARDTSQEGEAVDPTQLATLAQKLGVSEDADFSAVSAALDEALAERADPAAARPGTVVLDEATLEQLRADAAAGRTAREQQVAAERAQLVSAAVRDGRIPPARKDHWLAQLAADDGARATLESLPKGLIPVDEAGHADGSDEATVHDTYEAVYGGQNPQEG